LPLPQVLVKREAVERLESSAQVLEVKIETLADELSRNETAGELLKKQKDTVDKELRGAETRITELESLINNIQNDKEKILKEREACMSELNEAGRCNHSAKEKVVGLELKCGQARDKILDLEKQLEVARAKLARFEELFGENAEEISKLEKELATANGNVIELESCCELLEREKDELKRQLEYTEKQVGEIE
jgi:chromosome segregation ATPase